MIERTELPIEELTLDPMQSRDRAWSGDEMDRRLAESIETEGLYQDIIVRPLDDVEVGVTTSTDDGVEQTRSSSESADDHMTYAVIAGSRRYYAAMEAGYETIPCKIFEATDIDAAWTSLTENTDRRDLSEQEIAEQLNLIYELVRPRENASVGDETGANLDLNTDRFQTDREAIEYLAERFLGRDDDSAITLVEGHLRTANLPPVLQSLFKKPEDRTAREQSALENYDIDIRSKLGSGEGKSGTSREVVALHNTLESDLDGDSVNPTDAVLEAVGSLKFEQMSEQELRRTLRDFRHEVSAELESASPEQHREVLTDTLRRRSDDLRELHNEVESTRPFKKIDVLGPDTQRHSRWHVQVMRNRDASSHSELVRELYQERLEELAEKQGWD